MEAVLDPCRQHLDIAPDATCPECGRQRRQGSGVFYCELCRTETPAVKVLPVEQQAPEEYQPTLGDLCGERVNVIGRKKDEEKFSFAPEEPAAPCPPPEPAGHLFCDRPDCQRVPYEMRGGKLTCPRCGHVGAYPEPKPEPIPEPPPARAMKKGRR